MGYNLLASLLDMGYSLLADFEVMLSLIAINISAKTNSSCEVACSTTSVSFESKVVISSAGPLSHKTFVANVPLRFTSVHKMTHIVKCYLDGNIVSRNDGFLQCRKSLLINTLSNHHLGGHINEVHPKSLRNKGEGSRSSQVALDHLKISPKGRDDERQ